MGWQWGNVLVCPYCGGEIAEIKRIEERALYKCFNKKCGWKGTEPGEIHGRVIT